MKSRRLAQMHARVPRRIDRHVALPLLRAPLCALGGRFETSIAAHERAGIPEAAPSDHFPQSSSERRPRGTRGGS